MLSTIFTSSHRIARGGVGAAVIALAVAGSFAVGRAQDTVSAAGAAPAADSGRDSVYLVADLSDRTLTIYDGDSVAMRYPVAIGKGSKPTPAGHYLIRRIIWNPSWVPPDQPWAKGQKTQAPGAPANPMKVVKIFFKEPDYYIHGTDEAESIGEAESHGCQPRDESWFWRILHFRSETKTVYLDHAIPMTVGE